MACLHNAEMGAQLVSPQIKHHGGGHLFVNSSHPNDVKKKGTQRSIRSHSIRGACRGRPSRRRKPQAVTYALERPYVAADTRSCPDQICEQIPVSKSLNLWPFPCELQPRAQELIYFSAYLIPFKYHSRMCLTNMSKSERGIGLCLPPISRRLVLNGLD